jgi:pyruvate dehydrogenase E1 component alpha subunit
MMAKWKSKEMIEASVARDFLYKMILIREFETTAEGLTLRGKVPGGMHNSSGQEAVAVGVMAALKDDDVIASTHRSHHHSIARGMSTQSMMAELFTKSTGCSRGRGGSMHLVDLSKNYFGGNGIVGAGVSLAMGLALGINILNKNSIAVGFMGDGAINTGRTWESINMAVIWNLPLLIVIDNNQYAVETFMDRVTGGKDFIARASSFGMSSESIDGQDVEEVYEATSKARARIISGKGPQLINAVTYRYFGHNVGEVGKYRTQEEITEWKSTKDPIANWISHLLLANSITEDEISDVRKKAKAEIEKAVEFAESSPFPDTDLVTDNVDSGSLLRQL